MAQLTDEQARTYWRHAHALATQLGMGDLADDIAQESMVAMLENSGPGRQLGLIVIDVVRRVRAEIGTET